MESFVALAESMEIDVKIVKRRNRAGPGVIVKQSSAGTYLSMSSVTHGELSWPILEDLFAAKSEYENNFCEDSLDDLESDDHEDMEVWQEDEAPSPNGPDEERERESE